MANEGDESQVNSQSPSNINIQKYRRVTFSVDPVNEGSQSSTSLPSEGEALGNVLDVDVISRPYYEPIDTRTSRLRRSNRCKSEKKEMLLNNQQYWFHSILRIHYNDNRSQREDSNNLGVERDPKCSTSAFKRRLNHKYLSTYGPNNRDDRQ